MPLRPSFTRRRRPTLAAADGIYQCLAEVTIVNKRGLHARASAAFVKMAEQFDAEVSVTKDDQTVPGNSIMGLLMLGAAQVPRFRSRPKARKPRRRLKP